MLNQQNITKPKKKYPFKVRVFFQKLKPFEKPITGFFPILSTLIKWAEIRFCDYSDP